MGSCDWQRDKDRIVRLAPDLVAPPCIEDRRVAAHVVDIASDSVPERQLDIVEIDDIVRNVGKPRDGLAIAVGEQEL